MPISETDLEHAELFAHPVTQAVGKIVILIQRVKYREKFLEDTEVIRDPYARLGLVDVWKPEYLASYRIPPHNP